MLIGAIYAKVSKAYIACQMPDESLELNSKFSKSSKLSVWLLVRKISKKNRGFQTRKRSAITNDNSVAAGG